MSQCKTLDWFDKCTQNNIPADQASLYSMFIRNLEARLDAHGQNDIQIHDLLKLMTVSNQTLIEPIYAELNSFCNLKTDTELTLGQIREEKDLILQASERESTRYIYMLLGVSITQFLVFYWTIFQVEWLGRSNLYARLGYHGAAHILF